MTIQELNRDINGLIAMAKDFRGADDNMIAKLCGIGAGTLRNKRTRKELPLLSIWAVAEIARWAGYRIVFEPEGRRK